ncbi:Serine/threonine-protein_phosphatase 2A [Hexamita inflata]|uniref:Serine/threonine-protein_phosphatase 2A n=1 Tax=Hexamita inflata TaxID=28002 RepID=A0ABP1I8S6_9EUKA
MSNKQDELFTIAVLIDNLKHDDASERLNSVRALTRIATALGQRRARDELIPFLCDCCDDDDEVLVALNNQLISLIPILGGDSAAHLIFEPLRLLASGDSKAVRDAAVKNLIQLSQISADTKASFTLLTEKLLESEWYNWRQSGLQLISTYLKLTSDSEKRQKVLQLLKVAAQDQLPMVRRQCAESISDIVLECNSAEILQIIKNILKQLQEDVQDAVRAVSVKSIPNFLLQLAKLGNTADINAARKETFQKFITVNCTEISWRTRYTCADVFSQVLEAYLGFKELQPLFTLPRETQDSKETDEQVDLYLGNASSPKSAAQKQQLTYNTDVLTNQPSYTPGPEYDEARAASAFAKLLQDSEAEVRCVACQRAIRVANRLSPASIQQYIIPQLDERAGADDSQFVRVTLAKHLGYLSQVLSKEQIIKQLLPIMFKQLEDKDAEVRVTLLNGTQQVIQLIGIQPFGEKLTHSILVLSDEQDWRIRKLTLESVPVLSKFLTAAQFDEKLKNLVFNYLNDSVNYVRRTCVQTLVQVGLIFGQDWVKSKLFQLITEMSKKTNYLQRNNSVYLIEQIGLKLNLQNEMMHLLISLCTDNVPNIRFMAAEVIGHFAPNLAGEPKDKARSCLNELLKDNDPDVKDFAAIALSKM